MSWSPSSSRNSLGDPFLSLLGQKYGGIEGLFKETMKKNGILGKKYAMFKKILILNWNEECCTVSDWEVGGEGSIPTLL